MADIITKAFGGIEIAVGGFDDSIPRVRDVDLGEWLGLARPRSIRENLKRLVRSGFLDTDDVLVVNGEAWLTRAQALIVVLRSDAPQAMPILTALIDVYQSARTAERSADVSLPETLLFRPRPRAASDYTYFIRATSGGPIKIGRSSDPGRRCADIKNQQQPNGKRRKFCVLATIHGGEHEKILHKRFANLRVGGEWFRATPDLLGLIDEVNRRGGALPPNNNDDGEAA